jgi:hypothetical protein
MSVSVNDLHTIRRIKTVGKEIIEGLVVLAE